ncbi:MAG: hypothetical protein DRP09_16600 [Candidatus Thorarchaeota archaeon]|nr:MAG: hypothetical protein DRP09_16600 [Candidatus Thorarchaeota archaeon]
MVPLGHTGSPWPDQNSIVLNYHQIFVDTLTNILRELNDVSYYTFISGGALGTDQLAAKAVLNLKKEGRPAHLIIARPFPSQSSKWPAPSRQVLEILCNKADQVVDVSPDPYSPQKMQVRNEWMVDNSNTVMAVWGGAKKGGTWNCIQYAAAQGKVPMWLDPFTFNVSTVEGI